MPKLQKTNAALELSNSCFSRAVGEYTFEEAQNNGVVVKVTSWVVPGMGFHPRGIRVHVAITARLWKTIASIAPELVRYQTVRGRGDDVLWLAAYALEKARRLGRESAVFDALLPTPHDAGVEGIKTLRAAWCEDNERRWVTIGYPEDWASL